MIQVEVAYATPHKQWLLHVELAENSTIQLAIVRSGILHECSEINLDTQKVGIFGKQRSLSDKVNHGDRIEIYRSLLIDPKELRRIKAKKK